MEEQEFTQDIVFENKRVYVLRDITDIISRSIDHMPALEQSMFEIVSSKLFKHQVFREQEDGAEKVVCLVAKGQSKIINLHDNTSADIIFGDMALASGDTPLSVSGNCIVIDFYISSNPKTFGSGSMKFEVTALVNDKYTLVVNADSEEDAIAIANEVPIISWTHPTIEPGLKERKLLRYARWGNLSALEVE